MGKMGKRVTALEHWRQVKVDAENQLALAEAPAPRLASERIRVYWENDAWCGVVEHRYSSFLWDFNFFGEKRPERPASWGGAKKVHIATTPERALDLAKKQVAAEAKAAALADFKGHIQVNGTYTEDI